MGAQHAPSTSRQFQAPFGRGHITLHIPNALSVDYIYPRHDTASTLNERDIYNRIAQYIRARSLDGCHLGRVACAISDLTRPPVHRDALPILMRALSAHRITFSELRLYIGNGLHDPVDEQRITDLLPSSMIDKYALINHNARDMRSLIYLGESSRGTPIYVNRAFHAADFKITWGIVERHQFVGLTGGAKGVVIGLGGEETIRANHSLLTADTATAEHTVDNPVYRDIYEIGQTIGINLYICAFTNVDMRIIDMRLYDSHGDAVYQQVARDAEQVLASREARLSTEDTNGSAPKYDLVIAAGGGYPKDCNLYQLQKALANGAAITKPHGAIILVGACDDGIGDERFRKHFAACACPQEAIDTFDDTPFTIGPHKSYLYARSMVGRQVALISRLQQASVNDMHFHYLSPAPSACEQYIDSLFADHDLGKMRAALLPYAPTTTVRPGA